MDILINLLWTNRHFGIGYRLLRGIRQESKGSHYKETSYNKMTKERLVQFDILKGIGILCVLLGHTVLTGFPKVFIYGFHMSLFFFCSGVFFKKRSVKGTLTNNFWQLVIPYVFFLGALNGCYFITNLHAGYSISVAYENVMVGLDLLDENSHFYLAIWFLPCLFFVRIMYAIIQKITEKQSLNLLMGG